MTRPLFHPSSWKRVRRLLESRHAPLLVAADLDGTLAPIVPLPSMARVPARTLRSLRRAARGESVRAAVLSARPRSDLRRMVPVPGVLFVGLYGLEGPLAPTLRARRRLRSACARLTRVLEPRVRSVRGALLEPKGLTVAVHDRNVKSPRARRRLRGMLREVASREALEEGFRPQPGSRVVDFVPAGWDKGRAMRALRRRLRPRAVFYFGDSASDEEAFSVLGPRDVPVRVGSGPTRARYRVPDLEDVGRFLDAVASHRSASAGSKEVDPWM